MKKNMKIKFFHVLIVLAVFYFGLPLAAKAFLSGKIEPTDPVICIKRGLLDKKSNKNIANSLSCSTMTLDACETFLCTNDSGVNAECFDILKNGKYIGTTFLTLGQKLGGYIDQANDSIESVEFPYSEMKFYKLAKKWGLDYTDFAVADASKDDFKDCRQALTTNTAKKAGLSTAACCLNYQSDGNPICQARPSPCLYTANSYVQQHPLPGISNSDKDILGGRLLDGDGLREFSIYKSDSQCQKLPFFEGDQTSSDPVAQERWRQKTVACCIDSGVKPFERLSNGKIDGCLDENINKNDDALSQSVASSLGLYDTNIPNIRTAIYFRPTVGIPGTDFSTGALVKIDSSTFGKFLGQFFGFALSVVAIMAILMIIIAGATMYFKAAKGDINGAAKAKDQIKGAILGLVFTLAAVTIFRFISPRLVEIPSLTTENIAVNKKDIFDYQAVFGSSYGGGTNGDVASIALKEFERWGNGTVKESDNKDNSELPGYAYIKKYYYPAGNCGNLDPTTTAGAWSSAFISFVMKTAGINTFPASCMHTGYFKKIKDSPGVCVANRMVDIDKIGIGNILCKNRSGSTSVTFDNPSGEAHCDIVTNRSGDSIDIVGGNRDIKGDGSADGLTVAKSTVKISNIKNNTGYFGFIACTGSQSTSNGSNQSGSQCSNNYISDSSGSDVASSGDASYLNNLKYQTSPWPINVVKAQSIQESRWGTSPVAKSNNNYFGMICGSWKTEHPDKCASNGYRKYDSIQESLDDYYNTLNSNTWSTALANTKAQLAKNSVFIDYKNACQAAWFGFKHKSVSYAMDSNYSSKIVAILNSQFGANCPSDRSEYFKDATGTVNITAMANYTSCQL